MIETNNCIDELLNIIKNKKTIIAFKNQTIDNLKKKLIDKSKKLMKSNDNRFSTESITEKNVVQIDMKKIIKMIVFFDSNKFIEKNEFQIDDWKLKIENKLQKNVNFFSIENVKIEYVQNLKIHMSLSKKSLKICVTCTTIRIVVSSSLINFVIWKWKKTILSISELNFNDCSKNSNTSTIIFSKNLFINWILFIKNIYQWNVITSLICMIWPLWWKKRSKNEQSLKTSRSKHNDIESR